MEWNRNRPLGLILDDEKEVFEIKFLALDVHLFKTYISSSLSAVIPHYKNARIP
jgi:hypothetical protein